MARVPGPFSSRPFDLDYSITGADSPAIARFFNSVYAWMAAGLALTAVVAWYVSESPQLLQIAQSPMVFVFLIAEFGLVIAISAGLNRLSSTVATVLFMLYAALNGVTLSLLFLRFAHATLASTFFVTAGAFGITSLYGMVTKRDLTRLGSLFFMALIGIILASVVNIFLLSSTLQWIISYVGVLVFVGLTAFDTQRLKAMAVQLQGNAEASARMSVYGALVLYLDFLNLFLFLLQIFGDNNRRR
jgi:FtsH-binding integral membrane protein